MSRIKGLMEGRSRGLLSGGDRCSLGLTSLTLIVVSRGAGNRGGGGGGEREGGMVGGVQRMLIQSRSL